MPSPDALEEGGPPCQPRSDFPFISDVKEFEPAQLADWYLSSVETVFEDQDAWNPDSNQIGELTLQLKNTADPDRVLLKAQIDLDNGESVTLDGRGQLDDGTLTRGRLIEVVGTGRFSTGRHRIVWLRVRNPKRWGFDDVP